MYPRYNLGGSLPHLEPKFLQVGGKTCKQDGKRVLKGSKVWLELLFFEFGFSEVHISGFLRVSWVLRVLLCCSPVWAVTLGRKVVHAASGF